MKKNSVVVLFLILSIFGCGPQQVEKRFEVGVEVIINHIKPYRIEGQSSSLHLEEVMILDTEDPEVVAAGREVLQAERPGSRRDGISTSTPNTAA